MVCFDQNRFLKKLEQNPLDDTVILDEILKKRDDKDLDKQLIREKQKLVDEEFSQLCVKRLGKVHSIDHFRKADQLNLFDRQVSKANGFLPDIRKKFSEPKLSLVKRRSNATQMKNKDIRQMFNSGLMPPKPASKPTHIDTKLSGRKAKDQLDFSFKQKKQAAPTNAITSARANAKRNSSRNATTISSLKKGTTESPDKSSDESSASTLKKNPQLIVSSLTRTPTKKTIVKKSQFFQETENN